MPIGKLMNNLAKQARHDLITHQHLGWLKLYAETMKAENWRDMKGRIEHQLSELERHLGLVS